MVETIWPNRPKIFTLRPFIEGSLIPDPSFPVKKLEKGRANDVTNKHKRRNKKEQNAMNDKIEIQTKSNEIKTGSLSKINNPLINNP